MAVPEWPQLVVLKIPEIRETLKEITSNRKLENLKPCVSVFDGKNHLLELTFGTEWNKLDESEKNDVLNIILISMQKKLGDWVAEVREFTI